MGEMKLRKKRVIVPDHLREIIAHDPRKTNIVAEEYGISKDSVLTLRQEFGTQQARQSREVKKLSDPRDRVLSVREWIEDLKGINRQGSSSQRI